MCKIFTQQPKYTSKKSLNTWKKLGPLNLNKLIKDNIVKVDLQFIIDSEIGCKKENKQTICDYNGQLIIEMTGKKHTQKEYIWNGIGRANWESGDIYEGENENNKMMGYGRFIYSDGSYYLGYFKNSKGHG